jgi:hypothetical protein
MSLNEDPRLILGVAFGASADQIRAAYRVAAKRAHPDMGGSSEAFRRVRSAADQLLAELEAAGSAPRQHGFGEADRVSLAGHWLDVSGELMAVWGLMRAPAAVFPPQRIGLSPFIHGASLNAHAYQWLTQKVGPRGQDWEFNVTERVARLFFRREDDARMFKLRFS